MKIICLAGSYRKNGNTDRVTHLVCEHLADIARQRNHELDIETVYLGHVDISPCRGCRLCFDRGEDKCPLQDDLFGVKKKMEEADALLITSPVYVGDVSGIVKTWIDRLAHVCHRPQFAGKLSYILTTTGSTPSRYAVRTLQIALSTWGYHIVGDSCFVTGALMKADEIKARHDHKAGQAARKFFDAVEKQACNRPSFLSLMMFRIQQMSYQRFPPEKYDYRYWNAKGWLEKTCDFYMPHRAGRLKVLLARLSGSIVYHFVT